MIYTVITVKFDAPNGNPESIIEPKLFSTATKAMQFVMRNYNNVQIVEREYESHILYEFTESTNLYYITITQAELDS